MKKLFNSVYEGKRVLVTGDTGFKGSWLAIWLKELGAEVYGYSLPPKTGKDNFVTCNLTEKIKHEDGDIRDKEHLLKYIGKVEPEFAFHLAAQALVIDSYKDPSYTFETNIIGTVNFFEAVRNTKNVKAAVNITSDKCYQNNEWIWGYRENDPMGGKDPYSASKGCSELITQSYLHSFFQKEGTTNIASARAGNVIGGGDWAENRIVPDFFRALQANTSLFLRYPNSTRPWQHVLEPLSGYLLLASELYKGSNKYSGGWNFGPLEKNNFSVKELIEEFIKVIGKGNYETEKDNELLHEASLLKLDISKAMNLLEWSPVLNFDETVKLTVEGYLVESEKKSLYLNRVGQIENYLEIGKKKNNSWVIKK